MGLIHRRPPGANDAKDFRARERFDDDTYRTLALVGSVTVDLANITAGTVATFTIPVNGALANAQQTVALAPPSAIEAGLVWCGVVSANDVVTVRVHNTTGGGINPASAIWGARVFP